MFKPTLTLSARQLYCSHFSQILIFYANPNHHPALLDPFPFQLSSFLAIKGFPIKNFEGFRIPFVVASHPLKVHSPYF